MKNRNITLDIIRIFSLFCVIGVHFFRNSGFYGEVVLGEKMAIMCIIRSFFIICVPMFITLTGYLMNKKELSRKYYKGIITTLVIYLLCSIVYSIFTKTYLKEDMNIRIFFLNLLSYEGTTYSWYIEMYIGLFLIIPFLNIISNNLKNQKQAKILIITLIALIGLPGILNIYKLNSIEWLKMPSSSSDYIQLVPEWWTRVYPIFYYFLGAYLCKYKVKLNIKLNIVLLILMILLDGVFNYYRSRGGVYIWGTWNDYSSLCVMIITFLTFNLLLKIKINNKNNITNSILKKLSDACLGAYLVSTIFDTVFYNKLNCNIVDVKDRFICAPLVVIASFICSIILSIVINLFYSLTQKIISRITNKIQCNMNR